MSWTERQRAMLREMGIPVWWPQPEGADAATEPHAASAGAGAAGAATAMADAVPAGPAQAATERPETPAAAPARVPLRPPPAPAHTPAATPAPPARHVPISAVDALGWPELRQAVAACTACGLAGTRTQTVFGVGHPEAQWLIVGEAPGEQEDLQGEPFVGPAGQLLDAMLRALKLTRSSDGELPPAQRVYIANTLKCRPPRNRNPLPHEMAACEPFLLRQVALLRPRLILAMGRFAIQALLQTDEPVGRLRGRVHQWQGVPLVVTYHPAYLLRNLADKARAWDDLCLAAEVFERAGEGPR